MRFKCACGVTIQPLNRKSLVLLPGESGAQFRFLVFGERDIESAGGVELYVDSRLILQAYGKVPIPVAAGAGNAEKFIVPVSFHLRRQDSSGCPRSLAAKFGFFDHREILDAAARQRVRDRQSDDSAADDQDIRSRSLLSGLIGHGCAGAMFWYFAL